MAIPVSRNAMPYVALTMSLLFALLFGAMGGIGLAVGAGPLAGAGIVVALFGLANGARLWHKYALARTAILWSLGSMVVLLGAGALALRALLKM
jgi:hypothetical protein